MRALCRSILLSAPLLGAFPIPSASDAAEVLTLATTTSTENSGLLRAIHPDFQRRTGITIKVVAKGTGASLQLARDGNADVVLVHARAQEDRFVEQGHGVMRRDVMYNDFVILGPKRDPAGVRTADDPAQALRRIARGGHTFVSRGDGSGTHTKEQALWRETGLPLETQVVAFFSSGRRKTVRTDRPAGSWYLSIGQGMGPAIMMATERQAYLLADRGAYYAFAMARPPKTDLSILYASAASLHNPYGVIAVNPKKHPHVRHEAAVRYIEWITSPEVQAMIGRYQVGGKTLFHPATGGTTGGTP